MPIYGVVQFHHWFNLRLVLCLYMYSLSHTPIHTNKGKNWTKDKTEPQNIRTNRITAYILRTPKSWCNTPFLCGGVVGGLLHCRETAFWTLARGHPERLNDDRDNWCSWENKEYFNTYKTLHKALNNVFPCKWLDPCQLPNPTFYVRCTAQFCVLYHRTQGWDIWKKKSCYANCCYTDPIMTCKEKLMNATADK